MAPCLRITAVSKGYAECCIKSSFWLSQWYIAELDSLILVAMVGKRDLTRDASETCLVVAPGLKTCKMLESVRS